MNDMEAGPDAQLDASTSQVLRKRPDELPQNTNALLLASTDELQGTAGAPINQRRSTYSSLKCRRRELVSVAFSSHYSEPDQQLHDHASAPDKAGRDTMQVDLETEPWLQPSSVPAKKGPGRFCSASNIPAAFAAAAPNGPMLTSRQQQDDHASTHTTPAKDAVVISSALKRLASSSGWNQAEHTSMDTPQQQQRQQQQHTQVKPLLSLPRGHPRQLSPVGSSMLHSKQQQQQHTQHCSGSQQQQQYYDAAEEDDPICDTDSECAVNAADQRQFNADANFKSVAFLQQQQRRQQPQLHQRASLPDAAALPHGQQQRSTLQQKQLLTSAMREISPMQHAASVHSYDDMEVWEPPKYRKQQHPQLPLCALNPYVHRPANPCGSSRLPDSVSRHVAPAAAAGHNAFVAGANASAAGPVNNDAGGDDGALGATPWWWEVLPDFVPVEVLVQQGVNPRDGAIVHINYKSQFKDGSAAAGSKRAATAGTQPASRRKQAATKGRGRSAAAPATGGASSAAGAGFMSAGQLATQGGNGGNGYGKHRHGRKGGGRTAGHGSEKRRRKSKGGGSKGKWRWRNGRKVFLAPSGQQLTGSAGWQAYQQNRGP